MIVTQIMNSVQKYEETKIRLISISPLFICYNMNKILTINNNNYYNIKVKLYYYQLFKAVVENIIYKLLSNKLDDSSNIVLLKYSRTYLNVNVNFAIIQ